MANENLKATAPYNFIPVSDRIVGAAQDNEKLFSGTINCSLKALSPIFIGGISKNSQGSSGDIPHHDFLRVNNNECIIPGASIKGMLRNIVETISCSSMSNVSDDKIFYRRVNVNKSPYKDHYPPVDRETHKPKWYQGGFLKLENGEYILEKANVEQIYSDTDKDNVLITGPLPGKSRCNYYSFTEQKNPQRFKIEKSVFDDFINQMRNVDLQENNWKSEKHKLTNGEGVKVFYTLDLNNKQRVDAIGFCVYFRRAYDKTPYQLIRNNINDFSKTLFGRIDENCEDSSKSAVKGRVACLNAKFIGMPTPDNECELYLSSPHTTCIRHYLEQQSNDCDNPSDYNDPNAKLRGRKFYWNRTPVDRTPTAVEKGNVKILPLAAGSKAEFSIVVDKITFVELGAILEAIKLPSSFKDGHIHCHRIGGGKPAGLGAVEITIDSATVQNVKDRYSSFKDRIENKVKTLTLAELEDARKAFRDFIKNETGIEFKDQPFYKPLQVMTDFSNPPSKDKTDYMPLSSTDSKPSFAEPGILPTALEIKGI